MENKGVFAIVILLVVILSFVLVFSMSEATDVANKTELAVYYGGPIPLPDVIEDIKTSENFKGYDNETIAWMESLGDKQVFIANNTIVVMNSWDASRIPSSSEMATDVSIVEFIECNVLENHSLGPVKHPIDVLFVDSVWHIGEEVYYYDV